MSKINPRPDLHGAPVYLPDTGEISLAPAKFSREIHWMAQMFWQLLDECTGDEEAVFAELDEQYDRGYEAGYEQAMLQREHEGDF